MRFDAVLDSFYLLGSLWGSVTGSPVCSVVPHPTSTFEIARLPGLERLAAATAFVGVHVVPMDRERVLTNQTVLVEGGRITALGPTSQVKVPDGVLRVDGRGKYLMPGLGDMHEHNPMLNPKDRLFGFLANGVTTIRYIEFATVAHKQAVGIPGPHPRLYVPYYFPEKSPRLDSLAALVTAAKARGYDFIKIPGRFFSADAERKILGSIVVAARRIGLPVATHSHEPAFEQMLALGTRGSADHLQGYLDTLDRFMRAHRTREIPGAQLQALATAARRAGIWTTPTLNCIEARFPGIRERARQVVKALQDAGAGLLLGGDADFPSRQSPSMVHNELASLVSAGLTPYQALVTGTRNVAQYLGLLDSSGTVAVGKWADLVLLHDNPLQDIRHTREPAGVMIGGQWLDRAALDQRLLVRPTGLAPHPWPEFMVDSGPWVVMEVKSSVLPKLSMEQDTQLQGHFKRFGTFTDSLEQTKSLGRTGESTAQRLLQLVAAELGAMRTLLLPQQHEMFDATARVWLRAQARQGHQVTIPNVAPPH